MQQELNDNTFRGSVNSEARYVQGSGRLKQSFPVSGIIMGFMTLGAFITASFFTWNIAFWSPVSIEPYVTAYQGYQAVLGELGLQSKVVAGYWNAMPLIKQQWSSEYVVELYLHTYPFLIFGLFAGAWVGWQTAKPKDTIRHLEGVRLYEGKQAINYIAREIASEAPAEERKNQRGYISMNGLQFRHAANRSSSCLSVAWVQVKRSYCQGTSMSASKKHTQILTVEP